MSAPSETEVRPIPAMRSRLRKSTPFLFSRRSAARLISPLLLLVVWQIASASGMLPPRTLASPALILSAATKLVRSGELEVGLAVSFLRVVVGFSLALLAAIPIAVAVGLSRPLELAIDPPLQMLKAMPFLGLLPLFILWFGIGELPKVLLVTMGAFFPIYLTLYGGIRGVDVKLIEAAQTLGLGPLGRVRHVILPGSLPSLMVGIRYGLSVAWLSLVVGEQINANRGIGFIMANARDFLQTDVIVVCLLVYALMGLVADALIRTIEARALRWRPSVLRVP